MNNSLNNKNNSASNFISSSYKASTHKQIKTKKIKPVNNNNNNNNNMNVVNKNNISPEQKNRLVNQKMNEAKKNQNYVEMYMKYSKVQNFQTQRLNTSGNINNNYHYNNPLNNNSVRLMKSEMYTNTQHNLSNDKIMRGNNTNPNIPNNIKNNSNVIITKDGKRYVLAKNVQRIKREDDDNKIRNVNVINTDTNKISNNINESLNK